MTLRSRARYHSLSCGSLPFIFIVAAACGNEPVVDTTRQASVGAQAKADGHAVTLLTGDRVRVVGRAAQVIPAPGRRGVGFRIHQGHGRLSVVPTDVAPRIAAGELALAQFDVPAPASLGGHEVGHEAARDLPMHQVTFHVLDRQGAPSSSVMEIFNATADNFLIVNDGDSLSLTEGVYQIDAFDDTANQILIAPWLSVTGDTSITFDARTARPVEFRGPDPAVVRSLIGIGVSSAATGFTDFLTAGDPSQPFLTAQVGADAPPHQIATWVSETQADAPDGAAREVYSFGHVGGDRVPTGFRETVAARDFASVELAISGRDDQLYNFGTELDPRVNLIGMLGFGMVAFSNYTGPSRHTEHFHAPGFSFSPTMFEGDGVHIEATSFAFAEREYQAGHHYQETWNRAVFGPGFGDELVVGNQTLQPGPSARRTGDALVFDQAIAAGQRAPSVNIRFAPSQESLLLFRDGELISESDDDQDVGDAPPPFVVPPGAATYRYERTIKYDLAFQPLSFEIAAAWTFRSAHVAAGRSEPLAMIGMQFQPPVDDHNEVHDRVIAMPIHFDRPRGAPVRPIVSVTLEVSFDDGAAWHAVPVIPLGDQALAIIVHPPGAQHVSLRGAASDLAGSKIEETILRAYPVTP